MLGVGGGIFVVPILILAFNLQTRQAVGTSLAMIMFAALSGTSAYHRQKRIDWKVGISAAFVTVPGALVGSFATQLFSSRDLAIIFSVSLFLEAGVMVRRAYRTSKQLDKTAPEPRAGQTMNKWVWRRKIVDSSGKVFEYDVRIYPALVLLFRDGIASGFLGIGGGLIVVPILAAYVGLPIHLAVATSMVTMIFTAISSVSTHILLGDVLIDYAIPLVIGILLGAQLGAKTARQIKSINLERVFGFVVLAMGILLIITRI